ncbi:MAG: hemolysin family protein [Bacteroidota bacterium]|nr:hemolysin family protein [Bacteroidota bacterium]
MESELWWQIIIIIILVGVNAFFAASEIAIISLNDAKVKHLADDGDKKAKILNRLIEEPSKFLSTVQVGMTIAGFFADAIAALVFAQMIPKLFITMGLHFSEKTAQNISVLISTIVISYIVLVFGELAPKRLALEKSEEISNFVAKPVEVASKVASPFVRILTASTNFVVRLLGGNPEFNQSKITEEEIRMMINVGEEKGVLMEREKEMIDSIFEFDDTFAKEVMTPRIDMICISVDASLDDIVDLTIKEQFSRVPVYEGTIDNIIGVLNVKDLFNVFKEKKEKQFSVKDYLRPSLFIPENQKTDVLLKTLQAKRTEIAIVIDEYGGTAGLVTIEVLVEVFVGYIMV